MIAPNGTKANAVMDTVITTNQVRQSLYGYAKDSIGKTVSISCCEL